MLDDGFSQRLSRATIAEYRLLKALVQRLEHSRRRGKVHVGHPQRQDILPGVFAPLDRVRPSPVDNLVEGTQTSRC
jgi:hypothetical protein